MITVYHNQDSLGSHLKQLLGLQSMSSIHEHSLVPVAIVNTDDLETAVAMVQHLEQPWQDHPNIQCIQRSRSTTVGDVLRKDDGSCWLVTLNDFEQIEHLQLPAIKPKIFH